MLNISVSVIIITALGYIFPKSKTVFIIETLSLIIILGGYNGHIDLDNYLWGYIHGYFKQEHIIESLYNLVANIFSASGFSFESFHMILTVFSVLVMAYLAHKLTREPATVMSLMVGYSTLEYAWQLRALSAAAIISYALYYYFAKIYQRKKKPKYIITFLLLIALAAGFHFVSLFFVVFLLLDYCQNHKMQKNIVILIAATCICFPYILRYFTNYVPALADYLDRYRKVKVIFGLCAWQISGLIVTGWIYNLLSGDREILTAGEKKYNEFVYNGSILLLIVLPFYSLTSVATRIIRIWSLFYFAHSSLLPNHGPRIYKAKIAMWGYSIGSFILFHIILIGNRYDIVYDFLTNNLFW